VIGRFLDTKAARFAKFCKEPEISEHLFENVRSRWSSNPNRILEESLEIMEVFDFLSNFMLLHILDEPYTILSWRGKLRKARHHKEAADFILDSVTPS
jgi:hypothetical protein